MDDVCIIDIISHMPKQNKKSTMCLFSWMVSLCLRKEQPGRVLKALWAHTVGIRLYLLKLTMYSRRWLYTSSAVSFILRCVVLRYGLPRSSAVPSFKAWLSPLLQVYLKERPFLSSLLPPLPYILQNPSSLLLKSPIILFHYPSILYPIYVCYFTVQNIAAQHFRLTINGRPRCKRSGLGTTFIYSVGTGSKTESSQTWDSRICSYQPGTWAASSS